MQNLLLILIVGALCLSACAQENKTASGKPVNDGWYSNELSFPAKTPISSLGERTPYREGTTPEGYQYEILFGGGGFIKPSNDVFSWWGIDCSKDAMTDQRHCTLDSHNTKLFINYGTSSTPQKICISGHDFPYRTGEIRIDQSKPIKTDYRGCISGKYASQLAAASTVTTRRYQWPYDYSSDDTAPLEGLKSAMNLVIYIRSHIDRMQFEGGVKKYADR